jgi:hypothetical protein
VRDTFGYEIKDEPLALTAAEAHVVRVLVRAWQKLFTTHALYAEETSRIAQASVYGVVEGHFADTATHADVRAFCAKFDLPVPPFGDAP